MYYSYGDRKRNDFFIVTNRDNTSGRKNENLHALYSILEYCEEPYICRRKMQLNFLGEDFDERNCNKMCDNCKQDLKVVQKDMTREAKIVLQMVRDIEGREFQLTAK